MSAIINQEAGTIIINRGVINNANVPTIRFVGNGTIFNFNSYSTSIKNALDFIFDPAYYDNSALKGYLNTYSANSGATIEVKVVRDENDGRSGWRMPNEVDGKTVIVINWAHMYTSGAGLRTPQFTMTMFHELIHAAGLNHSVLYNIVRNENRNLIPADFVKDPVFRATAEFVLRRGLPFSDMSSGTQVVRWPGDPLYPVLTGNAAADAAAIDTYITKSTSQNTANYYSNLTRRGGDIPSYSDVDTFIESYINSVNDGRYLGALLGSTIGGLIGGNGIVGNFVGRSLFSIVGGKIGAAIGATYATGDIAAGIDVFSSTTFAEIKAQLGSAVQSAAIGAVSSILTMEMADALGLDGAAGQVFGNAVGSVLQHVANNAVNNINALSNLDDAKDIFGAVWDTPAAGSLAVSAVATFLGNRLGSMVVSPQTSAGVILSNLGSAAGAYAFSAAGFGWGASIFGVTNSSFWAANVIFPGVGAFVGFVVGALIGNLFGKKRPKPSASADTVLNFASGYYQLGTVTVNGGNRALVETMALEARDILNGLIQVVSGEVEKAPVVNASSPTQQYGHTGEQVWARFNGGAQQNFTDAAAAVEWGTMQAIGQTRIAGGDMLAKRVLAYSPSTTLTALAGDLQIASDYGRYLKSRDQINEQILAPWNSLSAADKSFFAANQAVMSRILAKNEWAISGSDLAFYNSNTETADRIIAALKTSEFAAGWMITLQRAAELKLDEWKPSDFYGGVRGFLDSFDLMGEGVGYEQVSLSWNGVDLGMSVPGTVPAKLFAAATTASADGRSLTVTGFGQASAGYYFSTWDAGQGRYTTSDKNDFLNGTSLNNVTFDDLYNGLTGGDDLFIGSGGNDTLRGRDGHDWLQGAAGDDLLEGGAGNDVLIGGPGADRLYGGDGDDYLAGGEGFDHNGPYVDSGLRGGAGNDMLVQNVSGPTEAWGDDGDDLFVMIWDNGDYDYAYGGAGNDTISYERYISGVTVNMTSGANGEFRIILGDTVGSIENATGSIFADSITGDGGANALRGLDGDDVLNGGDGNDSLEGGAGKDTLQGGNGSDTLSYAKSLSAVSVNLATASAVGGDAQGDTWTGMEHLSGSAFDDLLAGDTGANRLTGLHGNDWLLASAGADTLDGGDGFDTVDYSGFTGAITANLGNSGSNTGHTLASIEHIVGTAFGDTLSGTAADEAFTGGGGNDALSGGGGGDKYFLSTGGGNDTVDEDNAGDNALIIEGVTWSDLWFGTPSWQLHLGIRGTNDFFIATTNFNGGNNDIKRIGVGNSSLDVSAITAASGGGDGNDTIYGAHNNADLIFGYNGNDVIYGTSSGQMEFSGNVIVGGKGNDTIVTSAADDQFAFDRGDGADVITDGGGFADTLVIGPNTRAEDVLFEVDQGNGDLYIGLRDQANPGLTASQVADHVKVVGGGIQWRFIDYNPPAYAYFTIDYVEVGGTSIHLPSLDLNWYKMDTIGNVPTPPIIFDLAGDGLDLSTVDDSNVITRTESGALMRIGWVGPTDGILALDRDGDGQINKLGEISFVKDLPGATTDLEGLAAYDDNRDGVLDAKDKRFGEFRLWVDANQNGRSTTGELRTLADAGITAINLKGTLTGLSTANTMESHPIATTAFTRKDGTTGTAYDVALARQLINQYSLGGTVPERFRNAWNEDATLGYLENDPRLAALSASTGRDIASDDTAVSDALRGAKLDYDSVAARAVTDFTDHDRINARDAAKWADQLAGRKPLLAADGYWDPASQRRLEPVRAVSADGKSLSDAVELPIRGTSARSADDIDSSPRSTASTNRDDFPGIDDTAGVATEPAIVAAADRADVGSPSESDTSSAKVWESRPWYLHGVDPLTLGRVTDFGIGLGTLEATQPQAATDPAPTAFPTLPMRGDADQQRLVQALAAFRGASGTAAVRGQDARPLSGDVLASPALLDRLPTAQHLAA